MGVVSSIALRALEIISLASEDSLSLGLPPVLFSAAASASETSGGAHAGTGDSPEESGRYMSTG